MPMTPVPAVTLTPVAHFPERYFIENLVVRSDGSVLITVLSSKELWWVPPFTGSGPAEPVLVHSFTQMPMPMGIVEAEPDVFIICLSDGYTTHESHLARVDLSGWTPGDPVSPDIIYTFDDRVRWLNGACLLGPGVMAIADCAAGLIWRADLADGARKASARVWLADDTMALDTDSGVTPLQPGINGVRYGAQTGYLYYTSTAQKVFMRVPVDPVSLDPAGGAEFVAVVDLADDFGLDEDAGFAYVCRHRANTLERVPLQPRRSSEVRHIAGDPFNPELAGPSSFVWGRGADDHGRVAYVTTDGGVTAPPPDGTIRKSELLRAELLR
jgi:hypothetical protein